MFLLVNANSILSARKTIEGLSVSCLLILPLQAKCRLEQGGAGIVTIRVVQRHGRRSPGPSWVGKVQYLRSPITSHRHKVDDPKGCLAIAAEMLLSSHSSSPLSLTDSMVKLSNHKDAEVADPAYLSLQTHRATAVKFLSSPTVRWMPLRELLEQ